MTLTRPDTNYKQPKINLTLILVIFKTLILVAGNPVCEQGLVCIKIFAVLIFAGSSMSTLTAKFKGCLYPNSGLVANFRHTPLSSFSFNEYYLLFLLLIQLFHYLIIFLFLLLEYFDLQLLFLLQHTSLYYLCQ